MSEITKDTLMGVYPSVLDRDRLFNALGQSAAEAIGAAFLATKHASIYTRIAELDEGALDILAKDFNISWYDYNFMLETKRRVVAAAFSVHRNLGTTGAMVRAISAIWPNSSIEEWFEYGGDPYFFRALVEVNEGGTEEEPIDLGSIDKTIQLYKNERSWLQDDTVIMRITCNIVIETAKNGQAYHPPITGTLPKVSTHGNSDGSGLVIGAAAGANTYHPLPCGTPLGSLM